MMPKSNAQAPPSERCALDTVRAFWRLMATNDFASVAAVLDEQFVLEWPQSNERIRGPARYAQMNSEYVAHGPWRFGVNRMVASDTEVVTEVDVTDGVQKATAISFFTVRGGRVVRLVEYWPEPYAALPNRAHLTEPMR
jgi:ketosteroid isomerase-like protein